MLQLTDTRALATLTGHVGACTRRLPRVDERRNESCVSGRCVHGDAGKEVVREEHTGLYRDTDLGLRRTKRLSSRQGRDSIAVFMSLALRMSIWSRLPFWIRHATRFRSYAVEPVMRLRGGAGHGVSGLRSVMCILYHNSLMKMTPQS